MTSSHTRKHGGGVRCAGPPAIKDARKREYDDDTPSNSDGSVVTPRAERSRTFKILIGRIPGWAVGSNKFGKFII